MCKYRLPGLAVHGLLLLALAVPVGCSPSGTAPSLKPVSQPAAHSSELGHSHERGKMLLSDAGKYHALLTAHLAPAGNELDIFFETGDAQNPRPVALPIASFKAQVRVGEDLKELLFVPAPPDERPKDEKPDTCSHFVAKAPWMKPTDSLYVVVTVLIDGKEETIRWKDFNPKKYAHHEE